MALNGNLIIAGTPSDPGTERVQAISPINGEKLPTGFVQATESDVDLAASAASEAWRSCRSISAANRANFLKEIAERIEGLGNELVERCHLETGLPEARLTGERARTCNQLRLFATLIEEGSWVDARITTSLPDRTPPRPDIRRMLVSLGPVVVFGASNFPLAFSVAGGDTASALAAGCPVIVKAHASHPGTSELVGRAIAEAAAKTDMPAGVFSLIHGPGSKIGMALVKHPAVTAVGFTGSYGAGTAIAAAAAQRPTPIPVYAEMGSVNPVFVLPGAAKSKSTEIATGLSGSVTLGVGQFCTNPGMVAGIGGPEFDALADATGEALSAVEAGVMLNGRIRDAYASGVDALRANSAVTEIATGRGAPDGSTASLTEGSARGVASLFKTTGEALLNDHALSEEVFGPASVVVAAADRKELLRIANELSGHLTCTIHGTEEDLTEFADLVAVLQEKAGRLIFNGYPTGVEVCEAMTHGGPFPATTDSHFTSVGTAAILRFARPVTWQGFPQAALPKELQDGNPLGIMRIVDGKHTREA